MTQQPFIELYRPKNFNEVIGSKNKQIASILEKQLEEKTLPRAILFTGTTGCGKTSLSRIIANIVTTEPSMDILEMNMSDKTGVDNIRELGDKYHLSPMGGFKTYILDEIHNISKQAQDALLKLIENVPPQTRFILCTDSPEKLDKAIIGRCVQYKFERPEDAALIKRLKEIISEKDITIGNEAISMIVKKSDNVRKAINNLESLNGIGEITLELVSTLIESDMDENSNNFILTGILLWPSMFIKDKSEDKISPLDMWNKVSPMIKESLEKNGAVALSMTIAGYCRSRLLDQGYRYKKDGTEKQLSYQVKEFKKLNIILSVFSKDLFTVKPENAFCASYFKAIAEVLRIK